MFWHARRSWMDALYERSYTMQMGEVHLPGVDLYMLNDTEQVKRVMQTEAEHFPKSRLLHESLEPLLGESIFTTNGAQWQRQRTMMNPAFEQARLHVALQIVGLGLAAAAQQQLQHFGALGRELRAACRAMLGGGGQPLLHGGLGSTGGRGRR